MKEKHANILALETGGPYCQVGLALSDRTITRAESVRSHSQVVLSLVDEVLAEGDMSLTELQAIAVNIGPGSFTGIRVGIAVAQGLAFGADIPVLPLSSLQVMALDVHNRAGQEVKQCFVCIDARMSELYAAWYERDAAVHGFAGLRCIAGPELIAPEALQSRQPLATDGVLGMGSGQHYREQFPAAYQALPWLAEAADAQSDLALPAMLELAAYLLAEQGTVAAAELEPLYLRNRVAEPASR